MKKIIASLLSASLLISMEGSCVPALAQVRSAPVATPAAGAPLGIAPMSGAFSAQGLAATISIESKAGVHASLSYKTDFRSAQGPRAGVSAGALRSSLRPATAKLLANPASVVPSAETLAKASQEGASSIVAGAMARILGLREIARASVADAPPVAGSFGRFASRLAPSGGRTARSSAFKSVSIQVARGVGRAVWAGAFLTALRELVQVVFAGLPTGPAGWMFHAFAGTLLFWAVIESITAHEVGHAWTALKVGDVTPRNAGQISPSPLRFTGPIGASVLLVTSMMGFPLGAFGTNVQGSFDKVENKRPMAVMALAGPLVNILIGAGSIAVILGVKAFLPGVAALPWAGGTLRILGLDALLNFSLAVLNLIPLGPLDGQKVLTGVVPDKWHKAVHEVTFRLGMMLLLGLMVWGLGMSAHKAVTQNGAGTPFGNTGSVFIMSLMGNGLLLWLATMIPVAVKLAQGLRAAWKRRKILQAGGIPMSLTLPVVKGRSPEGVNTDASLAVPWSGDAAASEALAGKSFFIASFEDVEKTPADKLRILRATDGEGLAFDDALISDVRLGNLLLLQESGEAFFAVVPAQYVGGRTEVLAMTETAFVAARPGGIDAGRRLLKPRETDLVLKLSKDLKAPVYELALAPDPERPSLARWVRTEMGPAYFVRDDVLAAAALDSKLAAALEEYLRLLRDSIERPGRLSWRESEQAFFSIYPDLSALSQAGSAAQAQPAR